MSVHSSRPILASPVSSRSRSQALSPGNEDESAHHLELPDSRDSRHRSLSVVQDDFLDAHRRRGTDYETAPVDTRQPDKYFVRRPLARFVHFEGKVYKADEDGAIQLAHLKHEHSSGPHRAQAEHVDHIHVQRERLDLFMDLVWVGIISNVSENFFEGAFESPYEISNVFSEFLLLFLPTWAYWVRIQQWLNLYFMDDFVQRGFIIWLLVLALVWGNNTSFFLAPDSPEPWTIDSYIIGVASMKALELTYTIWIPWMRRQFLVELLGWVPALALWILAGVLNNLDYRYNFIVAAVAYDYVWSLALSSPVGDFLVGKNFRKAQDHKHLTSRYGNFFIIALGEGVFLLIRSSPLGAGLSLATAIGVQAIVVYFFISATYFRGDNSKRYVHAQNRSWYIQNLWTLVHVPLLCALVLLSSGVLYIVDYANNDPTGTSESENSSESSSKSVVRNILQARKAGASAEGSIQIDHETFRAATTTVYVSLAVIYASMLVLTLLNRNQDKGNELVIGDRYLRLVPRLIAVGLFATMWLYNFTVPASVLAWAVLIVVVVFIWETVAGMERWPRLFEPPNSYPLLPAERPIVSESDVELQEKAPPGDSMTEGTREPVESVEMPRESIGRRESEAGAGLAKRQSQSVGRAM